ncbi:von Willebrand factor type A [Frankia sp. AiPs1]|uniref:VWA domain-containing protein n=1 Tax=Frankia sp. AiPa1 TaxID=573492 RepID=UPI00202AE48B|nr:VWA domain-containing protein [Frankia sp. AiPa1]MCL9759975.1 VWA domain-containing protein [Frankia sp. AiPa1]
MVSFRCEVHQNPYLPEDGTQVDAVVTVTVTADVDGAGPAATARPAHGEAAGTAAGDPAGAGTGRAAGGGPDAVEVILLDCSGSMSGGRKMAEAQRAAAVAVDTLRDGVGFAVICGTSGASMIYPDEGLAIVSDRTRQEAKARIGTLAAGGGTAIGAWLRAARALMLLAPDAIHHALLLTDGQNNEPPDTLAEALAACEGVFQCDARGVGADWKVDELRLIATALLGSVALLRQPADIAADFQAVIQTVMDRGVRDVRLRIWAPRGARIRFVRQVSPQIDELTGRAVAVSDLVQDYPTGAWGSETRDYHVCVDVPPAPVGGRRLAARISLLDGEQTLSTTKVEVIWTDDSVESTRINEVVAHYTGQAELARAIQDGIRARQAGDEDSAVTALGRAAQLAAAAGDELTLRRLEKVVEIVDAQTGQVRPRHSVEKLDEMDLDASSTLTVTPKTP